MVRVVLAAIVAFNMDPIWKVAWAACPTNLPLTRPSGASTLSEALAVAMADVPMEAVSYGRLPRVVISRPLTKAMVAHPASAYRRLILDMAVVAAAQRALAATEAMADPRRPGVDGAVDDRALGMAQAVAVVVQMI